MSENVAQARALCWCWLQGQPGTLLVASSFCCGSVMLLFVCISLEIVMRADAEGGSAPEWVWGGQWSLRKLLSPRGAGVSQLRTCHAFSSTTGVSPLKCRGVLNEQNRFCLIGNVTLWSCQMKLGCRMVWKHTCWIVSVRGYWGGQQGSPTAGTAGEGAGVSAPAYGREEIRGARDLFYWHSVAT